MSAAIAHDLRTPLTRLRLAVRPTPTANRFLIVLSIPHRS